MRRLVLALGTLLVLAGLVAGHIWFWYLPRARPARPDPGSRVASLLADPRFPAALWLPYPHQNLGTLDPAAEDHQAFLVALARLSGLPPPVLPSFGGFSVVPSSELALAADKSGERFVVMAQVYPGLAMFSRLAGRLADNPWLAGGPVVVSGQAAAVRWEGNLWIVQSAQAALGQRQPLSLAPVSPEQVSPEQVPQEKVSQSHLSQTKASLGLLAVHRPVDPFPAGLYQLEGDAAGIRVTSAQALPTPLWQRARALVQDDLVLLIMAGSGSERGVQSLAFFRRASSSTDLPRSATLIHKVSPPPDRWRVPGASLARLAGALREGDAAGWHLRAIGDRGLASARTLAPAVARVVGLEAEDAHAAGALSWGLWADLGNTYDEVARLARLADKLPLIPRREARRWHDAETVLAPIAQRFDSLILVVTAIPPAFRLELVRRSAPMAGQ